MIGTSAVYCAVLLDTGVRAVRYAIRTVLVGPLYSDLRLDSLN